MQTIYVSGDAGWDYADIPRSEIPAGALHACAVLKALLSGAAVRVEALARRWDPNDGYGSHYDSLKPKKAEFRNYGGAWRISRYDRANFANAQPSRLTFCDVEGELKQGSLLVAHHADVKWPDPAEKLHSKFLARFIEKLPKVPEPIPQILINVSDAFPAVLRTSPHDLIRFQSEPWNDLLNVRQHVGIVTSLTALRKDGAFVTRRLSWEQGIEDLATDLYHYPRVRARSASSATSSFAWG